MSSAARAWMPRAVKLACFAAALAVLAGAAWYWSPLWLPRVQSALHDGQKQKEKEKAKDHDHDHDHDGHDHGKDDHKGHSHGKGDGHSHEEEEENVIELTPKAIRNIGLKTGKVALSTYQRTVPIPAVLIERPGYSALEVVAPITGIVTRVTVIDGQAVEPGDVLFHIRLTAEELVEAQANLLARLEQLDVVEQEIRRLESAITSVNGEKVIPFAGKTLLNQQYEKKKLLAWIRADRQRLLLHGLSPEHVEELMRSRRLISTVVVRVPHPEQLRGEPITEGSLEHPLVVSRLAIRPGQHVQTGQTLCVLGDHQVLSIEGKAFPQDAPGIIKAFENRTPVKAVIDGSTNGHLAEGLQIIHVSPHVDMETRALTFHVLLPNELVSDVRSQGRRFIAWRFRPGQRAEVYVPVEQWKDRIVLPKEAVVVDGPQRFVYVKHGTHFEPREVHVEYSDQRTVVVANDGVLKLGETIVLKGAYQVHLALRRKQSGGGGDAHAGHSHPH